MINAEVLPFHGELLDFKDRVDERVAQLVAGEKGYYVRIRVYPVGGAPEVVASGIDPVKPGWLQEAIEKAIGARPADPWKYQLMRVSGNNPVDSCSMPPFIEAVQELVDGRMTQARGNGESQVVIGVVDANTRIMLQMMRERTGFMQMYHESMRDKMKIEGELAALQLELMWGVGLLEDEGDDEGKGGVLGVLGDAVGPPLKSLGKLIDWKVSQALASQKADQGNNGTPSNGKGAAKPPKDPAPEPPTGDAPKDPEPEPEPEPEEPFTDDQWADQTVESIAAILSEKAHLLTLDRLQQLAPHKDILKRLLSLLDDEPDSSSKKDEKTE